MPQNKIWWNRKLVVQNARPYKKKNWPSEVGNKSFGMPNHSREREPCNVPSLYPPTTLQAIGDRASGGGTSREKILAKTEKWTEFLS